MTEMRVRRLTHAAVLVTDLARAKAFYGGVLGLTEKRRPDFDFPGAWYDLGDCELHLMSTLEALPPAERRPRRDYHLWPRPADLARLADVASAQLFEGGGVCRDSAARPHRSRRIRHPHRR